MNLQHDIFVPHAPTLRQVKETGKYLSLLPIQLSNRILHTMNRLQSHYGSNFIALFLTLFLFPTAHADTQAVDLSGIWHTEIEHTPTLRTALEFKLQQSEDGSWAGSWEMLEMMMAGNITSVHVNEGTIELIFNPGIAFKGTLSTDGNRLSGTGTLQGKHSPQIYTREEQWTSRSPARQDKQGKEITSWTYLSPTATDDGWQTGTLASADIKQDTLDTLLQKIIGAQYRGLDALLIARGGKLVLEEYFHFGSQNELRSLQSVTKSITSLLVGSAIDTGNVRSVDQPLKEFFPQYLQSKWISNDYPITLKHALMMAAGLNWTTVTDGVPYSDPSNNTVQLSRAKDMYEYVLSLDLDEEKPIGKVFEYNSGLSVILGGVIRNATGMPTDKYAEETLFRDLNIDNYMWTAISGQLHTGGGLYLKPRDLLKFGQLVLDKGRWNGRQILSAQWIEESTDRHLPVMGLESSKQSDMGYGYQWWRETFQVGESPFAAITANGYGGQFMWIIPSLNIVVLAMHHNPDDLDDRRTISRGEMQEFILPAAE